MTNKIRSSRCPVCHVNDWQLDHEAGRLLGLQSPYCVLVCSSCGQRKLDPQLNQTELEDLYSQGYFNSASVVNSEAQGPELPADYMDVATGRHEQFRNSVAELKALFPKADRFLDVGAASGDMVHIAGKEGLDAEGIEFSEFAVDQARLRFGLELQRIPLSEVPGSQYDLIHLNHVFEHFNDPVAELSHLHRIMGSSGGLYIEIPYQFHLVERIKYRLRPREVPFSLHSIHHPFFYTPRTIKKILRDNGFHLLRFRVFSKNRYPAQTYRQKLKIVFWWVLSWFEIGNYMEVIARKDECGKKSGP